MRNAYVLGLVTLLLATTLTGCTGITGGNGGNSANSSLNVPMWEIGENWLYTFSTPDYSDDIARLVVATVDEEDGGTAYMLGISSLTEARRHAVLNHNPFLGRITHGNLSAYENGEPQQVLQFPLKQNSVWEFTLFSIGWNAVVISADSDSAAIRATSSDGQSLDYVYDSEIKFFSSFVWTDAEGIKQLRMMFADHDIGYSGDVYFVRGGDLYTNTWDNSGPDAEIRDTFFVSGHPKDGEWDEMIYFLDASCGGGSSSLTLTLRDHSSLSLLQRAMGPGSEEMGTLGTISYPTQEYTLTLTFTGTTHLRLMLAGGITYSWTL